MIAPEDLDNRFSGDDCMLCAFVWWQCICDPARPYRKPTEDEIERARAERLTKAERARGAA